MHPEKTMLMSIEVELISRSRHTRFALARKGWMPGILKEPCSPLDERADTRCLDGMIMMATEHELKRLGTDATHVVMCARERIEALFEEEAHERGYATRKAMNDWGGYDVVCDALDDVKLRM